MKQVTGCQEIAHIALIVDDYDAAIGFYVQKLGFELIEDRYQPDQDKRWVTVRPKGASTSILLARASNDNQRQFVGNQSGGRVFLFLKTDDFWRDFRKFTENGVKFIREPVEESYGTVAVFEDLYGNKWDLLQYGDDQPY